MQGHEDMETVGLLGEGLDDGTGLLAGVLACDANEDLENWCLHDDRSAAGGGSASVSRGGRRGQGATPPHH
jgi:hypothetical protein